MMVANRKNTRSCHRHELQLDIPAELGAKAAGLVPGSSDDRYFQCYRAARVKTTMALGLCGERRISASSWRLTRQQIAPIASVCSAAY